MAYINGRYRRTGTLWEGRYKSCLVDAERYLLTCERYIELNSGVGREGGRSSRLCMVELPPHAQVMSDAMVVLHAEYLRLGADEVERCAVY